jgi:hypothetical protein
MSYALTLAIGVHQFFELGGCFDFEKNFFSILNLDQSYLAFDFKV